MLTGQLAAKVTDALFEGGLTEEPTAVSLDTGEKVGDWKDKFTGLGKVHRLKGAGRSRVRKWLWSLRSDMSEGMIVWIVRRNGVVSGGLGVLNG